MSEIPTYNHSWEPSHNSRGRAICRHHHHWWCSIGEQSARKNFKTFAEYAMLDVLPTIKAYSNKNKRTDIVFDVYRPSSLKAETRSGAWSAAVVGCLWLKREPEVACSWPVSHSCRKGQRDALLQCIPRQEASSVFIKLTHLHWMMRIWKSWRSLQS